MPIQNLLVLAPGELVRVGNQVFRKQLLRYGRWIHPADENEFFEVTPQLCDSLVKNFSESNYNDFVPVMMAKDQSEPHKVIPTDTVGRVVSLQRDTDGLYALVEFGDQAISAKASQNLIPGVSAGITLNFLHKELNKDIGPVLKHVVLCNEPYIKNLRGFEQVQFAVTEPKFSVFEFDKNEGPMNREQLIAAAKALGIDIVGLEAAGVQLADVKKKLPAANGSTDVVTNLDVLLAERTTLQADKTKLSGDVTKLQGDIADLKKTAPVDSAKLVELSEKVRLSETESTALRTKVTDLELANKKVIAGNKVESLIREGKLIPAQRDIMVELAVKDEPTFTKLTENAPVVVQLGERGRTQPGEPLDGSGANLPADKAKAEIDRLTKAHIEPRAKVQAIR